MLANPHSRILTPLFLLHLMFGPWIGLHLEITLHLAAAWIGAYTLMRVQGLRPIAGLVCGSVFAGSSWISVHLAEGHTPVLSSLFLPWIAASLWLGIVRRKFLPVAIAGGLAALTLFEGGVYAVPQAFLLGFLLVLVVTILQRSLWPMVCLGVFAFFAAAFAAIKLLPTYELLRLHRRLWTDLGDATSLRMLSEALFSRDQDHDRQLAGAIWGFWEYGAYIGTFSVTLAAAGIATGGRRMIPWLVASFLFLALILGNDGPYSPWILLHRLPIWSSERVPSRFVIPFVLAVAVCAGFGADFIAKRVNGWGSLILYYLIAVMIGDLWLVGVPNLHYSILREPPDVSTLPGHLASQRPNTLPAFHELRNQNGSSMLEMAVVNEGSIDCYEYTTIRSPVMGLHEGGDHGEQYLIEPGTITLSSWSPNRLRYIIDTSNPQCIGSESELRLRLANTKRWPSHRSRRIAWSCAAGRQGNYRVSIFTPLVCAWKPSHGLDLYFFTMDMVARIAYRLHA